MFSQLTWDIFILVFFGLVLAYSFIIGRKGTTKIILASYVAILTADGLGNFLIRQFIESEAIKKLISFAGFTGGVIQFGAFIKIFLMIFLIVYLSKLGTFEVQIKDSNGFTNFAVNSLLAIFSGGLILSVIIVFASGGSLITGSNGISSDFVNIYNNARTIKAMIDWQNFWFAAPGVVFVIASYFTRKG